MIIRNGCFKPPELLPETPEEELSDGADDVFAMYVVSFIIISPHLFLANIGMAFGEQQDGCILTRCPFRLS
ncbi:hypothetical protein HMPREF1870_00420 [Bacteroidales bacterium KA00344]|nr:hypothetical protein HMPREF1870_00420 [Bacteroidales bacterium KA00344]